MTLPCPSAQNRETALQHPPITRKNRWLGLRHGRSKANEQGIVVSSAEIGCHRYGLTEEGKLSVSSSVRANSALDGTTLIFSSDFKRTAETAAIVSETIGARQPVTYDTRLRERFFGDYEGTSADCYERVWNDDALDANNASNNIESPRQVGKRTLTFVTETDALYSGQTILIVSHGDPLQILTCMLSGQSTAKHRSAVPWETAEIREFAVSQI